MLQTEAHAGRWCVLRTSGPRTLPLVRSLSGAGYEAWAPVRITKRLRPRSRLVVPDGPRPTIEVELPLLPTFVFARAIHLPELLGLVADRGCQHPPFSIVASAKGAALVADEDVAGLREAEREAADLIERLREAETSAERDRIRLEAIRSKRDRQRAAARAQRELREAERAFREARRAVRPKIAAGETVTLRDAPAFVGMSGIIESTDGRHAWVSFGGRMAWKVEAWQIVPNTIQLARPVIGHAVQAA